MLYNYTELLATDINFTRKSCKVFLWVRSHENSHISRREFDWATKTMPACRFDLRRPRVPNQNCFQRSCVLVNSYEASYHLLTLDFWKQTAAWCQSQGPDCVVTEIKWNKGICAWDPRWIRGRSTILSSDFSLLASGVWSLLLFFRVENLGSYNSLKLPQISKVSVQTASNTPWMQGKALLLRILQYSCPVKSIVNYPIQTLIFWPWPLLRNTVTAWAWTACGHRGSRNSCGKELRFNLRYQAGRSKNWRESHKDHKERKKLKCFVGFSYRQIRCGLRFVEIPG